ncbi:MAG TPA: sigma-70 family RNA polymerase sigma factor, partial [Planctomycetota bacterium]|nr:sigma-70 family RNA polymerase sigma factor [Planctomycetota bacterium]
MDHAARLTPDALLAHEAFVLRLARSLVRDEATARDVAQETWLSALEHPPRPGSARAWLARVTRNHALNLARGRGRREARERAAARDEGLEAEAGS